MANLGLLNLGMMDQRLAFHWIQENIEAFGGDPDKGRHLLTIYHISPERSLTLYSDPSWRVVSIGILLSSTFRVSCPKNFV